MPFEQAFKLCSLLLAGTAFGGLVLAHSVPAWLAVVTAILLMISLLRIWNFSFIPRMFRPVAIPSYLWSLSLIGVCMLFVLDLAVISRELLPAGIHFLVMLLGIKLISLHERRDYRQLYAISLMAILASAALTTEVWYIPIFFLYLLAAVWTLLLYHLTKEPGAIETNQNSTGRCLQSACISGRFFWLTNAVAITVFCFTVGMFFLMPRVGAGILQKPRGEGLKTTGFSERVDLGMIGSVKQDPHIVMRVELPELPKRTMDRLYLRGVAYDRYNGRSWIIGNARRRNLGSFGDGTFAVHPVGSRRSEHSANPIQQDILLEALDTPMLFAVPFAEYVSGEFPGLHADSMGALYLPSSPASRVRYSVTSQEHRLVGSEQTAPALEYPPAIRDQYLQIAGLAEKVVSLSRQIVQPAATPYDQVVAIQQHLLQRYRYSLDVETTTSPHPLEDFLLTRRTGYCEHYATAMVMMLRAVGIPARLVTGFLATEWNEFGSYFTVRQRDAHAWVEVYFPQSGWITFDPTPATGVVSSVGVLYRFGESLRLYWDRLFIRYSARDQLAVVHGIRDGSQAMRDRLSQWVGAVNRSLTLAVSRLAQYRPTAAGILVTVGILMALGVTTVLLVVRKQGRSTLSSDVLAQRRQLHITRLYRNMLQATAKKGFAKPSTATPTEFARLMTKKWAAGGAIITGVTDLYCRGRFSDMSLTEEELACAEHQLSALKQLSCKALHLKEI